MTGKVVLLPREWNSPDDVPDEGSDIMILLNIEEVVSGFYGVGEYGCKGYTLDETIDREDIKGWCYLVQQ